MVTIVVMDGIMDRKKQHTLISFPTGWQWEYLAEFKCRDIYDVLR